jgi:hypothetical protein
MPSPTYFYILSPAYRGCSIHMDQYGLLIAEEEQLLRELRPAQLLQYLLLRQPTRKQMEFSRVGMAIMVYPNQKTNNW